MGIVANAFGKITHGVGDVFDSVGDRISMTHIANKVETKTSSHNTGFLGGMKAAIMETPENIANWATLGAYRQHDLKLDMKELDDMSKSERYENIAAHKEQKVEAEHLNTTALRADYRKIVDEKHSHQNDGPDI